MKAWLSRSIICRSSRPSTYPLVRDAKPLRQLYEQDRLTVSLLDHGLPGLGSMAVCRVLTLFAFLSNPLSAAAQDGAISSLSGSLCSTRAIPVTSSATRAGNAGT